MIIAGFASVGKSTFCEKYKDKAVDFICMPYKYKNFEELAKNLQEGESIKAHDNLELVLGWQNDYFEAIKEYEKKHSDTYIFIPTESIVLKWLYEEGIPYIMIYPEDDLREEYKNRYVNRGDSERFIEIFVDGWDSWMKLLRQCPGDNRIILKSGEFVADKIKPIRLNLCICSLYV